MAKIRSIDPAIWKHPAFLRTPWFTRDVFLYLFSAAADDEGRFLFNPIAILEAAFPRSYPVTDDDVLTACQHLVDQGLTVRYGPADEYGFLCGWFEHQYIQKDRRTPSSFPEPPVAVASWEMADKVRQECADALQRSIQQVTYHDALDWNTGRERTVNGALTKRYPEVEVEVEVEVEREEQPSAEPKDGSAPPEPEKPKAKPRKALTEDEYADAIAELRARIPADCHSLVDAYLDAAAEANATKRIAAGRAVTLTTELADAADEFKGSPGAFRYGLEAAVRKRAVNANYVRTAAAGHNGKQPQLSAPALSSAERQILAIREQQAREAAASGN